MAVSELSISELAHELGHKVLESKQCLEKAKGDSGYSGEATL